MACIACAAPAAAQSRGDGSGRAALRLEPTLGVTGTATDNDRSSGGGGRADLVTEVTPGLRLSGAGAGWQASVDYGLSAVLYARDADRNYLRNRLSASARAEPWQDRFTIDALASITQGATSAFGSQVPGGSVSDINSTEVRSLTISPALRGQILGIAQAQASASASWVQAGSTGDSQNASASLSLSSLGTRRLGWGFLGSSSVSDFDRGRRTRIDRAIGSIIFQPDVDWRFTVRGGQERTDLTSLDLRVYDNYGAAILWTPSPRTRLQLEADKRSFGHSHLLAIEHRQKRFVFRLSDSQDLTSNAAQTGAGVVPAYALYYQLFASQEPDPVLRDALVRNFLARNNLRPDTPIGGGFVSAAVSVQRRQEASVAYQLPRTSYVLSAFSTRSRRADTLSTAIDDLSLGPLNQRGLSFSASHQLSPVDTVSVSASALRSRSVAATAASPAAGQGNLYSLSAIWGKRVSQRTNVSLSVRHSEYDGGTDPYTENAVSASLSTRF